MFLSKFVQQSWKKLSFSGVPHPQNLTMNRQLRNSIFISWDVPENIGSFDIQAYHIYVNGQLRSSVKASERTKALLEDINFDETHRVSVKTVSSRGQSKEAECTMLVGRG